ncbi:NAD-dependent epimerase/dehydratase family protein [Nocardia sp. CDC159]|uniref:NAD-dependent epimerase/dehydratase family protein n=1 Tax=Nocardia pulmonis TaxID=2951408 RepID=A0A9X2E1M6_9NOCA|nr:MULTISPECIES: NAD-dependent epimerase/dehydratase family protein [Nocardia]MCM6772529.1 NAD-dependent epimerase/dehydratase family protein [Nocardia pulmonis]MCM6784813.1 NAD-dependent epimerase/dehydratase family protein [Nocardia sp. CDC159]
MTEATLVTGASGCLGAALTRALVADGERVVALVQPGAGPGGLRDLLDDIEIRYGDVTDPEALARALRGVARVYHLAGIAVPLNGLAAHMWEVNVLGAQLVARAAAAAGVRRMVHVSSSAAVGYPPADTIADETFDVRDSVTTTAYGTTKLWGERLVLDQATADFDVVVVNPTAVYAPGGHPHWGWSRLVSAARRGLLRVAPTGGTAVCAAHDFVDGTRKAMRHGRSGRRYLLGSANLSYAEIGAALSAALGRDDRIREVPAKALRTVARLNAGIARLRTDPLRSPLLVPENADLMTRRLYYSPRRAVTELGLSQTPVEQLFRDLVDGSAR